MSGDPLDKLLEIARNEGITQDALDKALSEAFKL